MCRYFPLLCTLLFLTNEVASQSLYYPPDEPSDEWTTVTPQELSWNTDSLDALYDYLESELSNSFIVLQDGRIVLERYWGDYTPDNVYPWFSAGKSLRSVLVGMAIEAGNLQLNDPVSDYLGQGWTSLPPEQEDSITVFHQITMSSGLDPADFLCTDSACLTYEFPAGTRWYYHNAPYSLTRNVLEAATGQTLNQFTNPLEQFMGSNGGFWLGNDNFNTFYYSTARQMARFGLMVQGGGVWNGNALAIGDDYFSAMLQPSQPMNPSYGYLWWLNGQNSFIPPGTGLSFPGSIAPDAPEDVVLAAGANGQLISISRERGIVFVRQGQQGQASLTGTEIHNEIWRRLQFLLPEPLATSGSELATSLVIRPYPNPATERIRIDPPATDYALRLLDINGRELRRVVNQNEIGLSGLPTGAYWLEMRSADKTGGAWVQKD